jgi:hypothetical protein
MSFDLYLAPASGFLDWTGDQWDRFFDTDPESVELGRARYVVLVLDLIAHNLEGGKFGSRFRLFARIDTEEQVGWYNDEIELLRTEIESIREGLGSLPVSRSTLAVANDEELETLVRSLRPRGDISRPASVYELLRFFFDGFQTMINRASTTKQGLYVVY